jgi:hypothetical protein
MAGLMIDSFDLPLSNVYADNMPFGIGQGPPDPVDGTKIMRPIKTYQGNMLDLFKYIGRKQDDTFNNLNGPGMSMVNGNLFASVAGNALTVSIKTFSGDNPSANNPASVVMRHNTMSNGAYVVRKLTATTSFTVNAGQTLGVVSGQTPLLLILGINDTNFQLGLVNSTLASGANYIPDEWTLKSSTGGNGGASAGVIYSPTSAVNKSIVVLGFISIGVPTAGQWSQAPTIVQNITASALWPLVYQNLNDVDGGSF